jgi:hypothetical protein
VLFCNAIQCRLVAIDHRRFCEAALRLFSRHKHKLKKLNDSIPTVGYMLPIVIDSENIAVAGRCFLQATHELDADELAVATVATGIKARLKALIDLRE